MEKMPQNNIDGATHSERRENRNRYLCSRIRENVHGAEDEILLENEKMIVAIARETVAAYGTDRMATCNIEQDDLAQEGRIALLNAAGSYEPDKDISFSTYAYTVIKNAMCDLVRKGQADFESHMISTGSDRVFLDEGSDEDEGLLENERQYLGGDDPTGDLAVHHVIIEKMGNRLLKLKLRKFRLIEFRYGLRSREYQTWAAASRHFGLNEHYLMSIENEALKELREGMNDGKIV